MKIKYKTSAYKQLGKLQQKDRKKILKKINQLQLYPTAGKKLEGKYASLRTIKAWPFRIIYKIEGKSITIQLITHRQSAYKN